MRIFFILLTTLFLSLYSFAQSENDSVKMVINTMFIAMKNGDPALFKTAFADSAILQTITPDKQGKMKVQSESLSEFTEFVGTLKKDAADERISFETIKTDGPLAIAWTPYTFYYNSQFSHCGVNSFQLVRLNGLWKIQYIIDTRRRQGCQL